MVNKVIPKTKTDQKMEDAMVAFAHDQNRVRILNIARTFKRSWLELAEALTDVHNKKSWERWGYESFELYYRRELHLKKNTVTKLLASFRFLNSSAPSVIERSRKEINAPIPSLQAVNFVAKATERGAADEETMDEIKKAAFEEGLGAPKLARRFKEVAFPLSADEKEEQLRAQITNTARKLATLVANADAPLPHDVAANMEEALGELLETLDSAN